MLYLNKRVEEVKMVKENYYDIRTSTTYTAGVL